MRILFSVLNSVASIHSSVNGRLRYLAFLAGIIVLFCLCQQPNSVLGQHLAPVNPYRVEAAFLRNFAHYVTWPPQVFDKSDTPWQVCILGPNPFHDFLEHTFAGRTEQGRSFKIIHTENLDALPPCHIVFITFHDPAKRRAALAKLNGKPVLTVGEAADFLKEGGIIQFQVGNRVSMSVNLDQANSSDLNIQTKMLEVSEQVIEKGRLRKMR